MSYVINRNLNFKTIKKTISIYNTINTNSLKESLGSTGNSDFLSINTLSINNLQINASANELNYLQVTPGIAEASKALVLDSSKNIMGINILNCTSNIIVNNTQITSNADLSTGSSDDLNNPYLTNTILGTAQSIKVLVVNTQNSISNINKLTTNSLKIKNYNLQFNKSNQNYNTNLYSKLNYVPTYNYIDRILTNSKLDGGRFSHLATGWSNICWSSELKLYVIIATSGTKRVMISEDGYGWQEYSSSNDNISWYSLCWSPDLNIFVAGGASGNTMYSTDGKNWLPGTIVITGTIISICWSKELNLFIGVSSSGHIINSIDGINWNESQYNAYYSITFTSICWANNLNLFLACGSSNSNSNTNRLLISNDGYVWQPIYHNLIDNVGWNNITWSEELNLLIMSGSTAPQRVINSNDGINWNLSYPHESSTSEWNFGAMGKCIWIRELHIFISIIINRTGLYYSYDGIRWNNTKIGNTNVNLLCWANNLGSIIMANTSLQFYILSFNTKTYLSGLNSNKELININQNNNYIGMGTDNPQTPLHINDPLGKCLKLHPYPRYAATYTNKKSDNYAEFNILSNGQFDINSNSKYNIPSNVNIITNFNTYGLKLNNVLLTPNIIEYNYMSNITNGIANNSKALILDNNLNISNINTLNCNSFTVNGINIDDSNNNQYLQNLSIGNASSNKALMTDTLNNINNINTIKTKRYDINYDKLYGSNNNNNINLITLNNKYNVPNNNYIVNRLISTSTNWVLTTSNIAWSSIIWCDNLGLFVATSSSGLYTSVDGINWTADTYLTFLMVNVCWSSDLNILIAISANNTEYNIFVSYDAKSWYRTYTSNYSVFSLDPTTISSVWVNELKSFIIITNAGQISKGLISHDGYNWHNIDVPTKTWTSICWCNKLNLLVAVNRDASTDPIATSKDAISWTFYNILGTSANTSMAFSCVCWSPELNIVVASTPTGLLSYSYDGINWYYANTSIGLNQIIWIKELNIFIGSAGSSFGYSYTGIHWTSIAHPISGTWNYLCWSPGLSTFVTLANSGTTRIATNIFGLPNTKTYLSALPNQLYFNKINSRLGLGTNNPNYQLELSTDNAAKPSTSTWTIVSDSRLKENIELADLDQCYNIIKNLKLKRYKWKDTIFEQYQIYDRTKLGWIADEVEEIFPKAISEKNAYNLNNCKTLNIDQIIASVYGFTQKLMINYENIDLEIIDLQAKLQNIDNFITDLDI